MPLICYASFVDFPTLEAGSKLNLYLCSSKSQLHMLSRSNEVWAVGLATGKPCALAENSSNSLFSFAVNSDDFVILQNNACFKISKKAHATADTPISECRNSYR